MDSGFSNLPEAIIHHIMSFLPIKDASRMSILSKSFNYSWRSFPMMNFDYLLEQRHAESFLDSLIYSLQHRLLRIPYLQKLRFCGFPGNELDSTTSSNIHRMINFGIENNVGELELEFIKGSCCLPPAIFSAKSIKILTLIKIESESRDFILNCPCLEIFNLIACKGIKNVTLASNAKLKAVKIDCFGIKDIHFESAALCLESFFCCCCDSKPVSNYVALKFNISTSTTPNLKHLLLKCLSIPDELIESQFAEFRYLETLNIQSCYGSKKMIKFHLEYLKDLYLYGLDFDKIEIEAPRMVILKILLGKPLCEIDISSMCKNIKYMHLEFGGKDLPYKWIRNNFAEFSFLETLILVNNSCKKEEFLYEYLKNMELNRTDAYQVEIEASSMPAAGPHVIAISSSSTNLKHLQFHGEYIPDIWIKNNFSQFLSLETLELDGCINMNKIRLCLECLKCLKLKSGVKLSQVEIEAPNLVSLIYEGTANNIIEAPQVIINPIAKPDVMLHLPFFPDNISFRSMRNFVQQFAQHCETLTLRCKINNGQQLIYPKELRRILVPAVYNLKHLKVELKWLSCTSLVELVDSLLWLAPHPNTISFILQSQVKSLKFHYNNKNVKSWLWRDDLEEVTMKNFENNEMVALKNYLSRRVKRDFGSSSI